MTFHPHQPYHIYNRGNNQEPIFFSTENYLFFLKKMRMHLLPEAHILAYCLMPNHFHWLVHTHNVEIDKSTDHPLNQQISTLLSSYAQAINNRYTRKGSLFQQNTKAVQIESRNYGRICFHYIHQNPIKANLVEEMGEWPFSSFPDYRGSRNGTLAAKEFTFKYLDIDPTTLLKESKQEIDSEEINELY